MLAVVLALFSSLPACRSAPHTEEHRAQATHEEAEEHDEDGALRGDWCVEHGLPESQCTKCHPELVAEFKAADDWCPEHGFPESACPVCHPQTPPPGAEVAAIESRVVRLAEDELESAAGIETVAAEFAEASPAIECTARIVFDADRIADIRAIVPGIVRTIHVELGDTVEAGDPLFTLESTQVSEVQGALQRAREEVRAAEANLTRKQKLRVDEIASARELEVAERELATARAQVNTARATLRLAGAKGSKGSGRYQLASPIAGTIVRRPAVLGVLATEENSLSTVADTSVMWALCDVSESDSSRIAVGQRIAVHTLAESSAGKASTGEISWIAAEVDPKTRTVTARAELDNDDGRLRANQFAKASIETGAPHDAVSVPRDAVQRVGKHEVVFVRTEPGVYEPRVVERHGAGERVHLEGRLEPGDQVVTTGAVLLRTEVLPDSIGAGCCEVKPGGDE